MNDPDTSNPLNSFTTEELLDEVKARHATDRARIKDLEVQLQMVLDQIQREKWARKKETT